MVCQETEEVRIMQHQGVKTMYWEAMMVHFEVQTVHMEPMVVQ